MFCCSLFDFPQMADKQLSYILGKEYAFYEDAAEDCPLFAKAAGPLEKRLLPLDTVAIGVRGLTGKTAAEQEALVAAGCSRLRGITMPIVTQTGERRALLADALEKLGLPDTFDLDLSDAPCSAKTSTRSLCLERAITAD